MSAPGRGHFWSQGNNLNNLGRCSLGEAMYQLSKAWAFCFQTKRFYSFSLYGLCKTTDPRHRAIFDLRAIILTNLIEVHQMKLHIKYQRPGPSGFRKEDFFKFSVKKSTFSFCDLDVQWTGTIWTTLKEDQPRIIPVKFGQNPICGLEGDGIWRNCLRTDARRTKCDHKSLPCHYVTGKLKKNDELALMYW